MFKTKYIFYSLVEFSNIKSPNSDTIKNAGNKA